MSPQRRRELLDALRRGTVPRRGLGSLAVGLSRFEAALDDELLVVEQGGSGFKAIRGEYGSGKTFFARWLEERAQARGWVTAEVQVSETETPLHRLETVYRRLIERLSTPTTPDGAFRSILDGWFYTLEQDVLADGAVRESDTRALLARTDNLLEMRLAEISRRAPGFTQALRSYRRAMAESDVPLAEGLVAWLGGQPHVAAAIKQRGQIKGEIDHDAALSFLQGLLVVLKDSGYPGLLVVLDEVETLQRVKSDTRDKSLNALRQWMDEIDGHRFPGLYLVITGTSGFFDGPHGVQRLAPLAQRLHVDFGATDRFDNPRAVQLRLPGFKQESLLEVGVRVRDIFAHGSRNHDRIREKAPDAFLGRLASSVAGELGGKVGVAPRLFLKKLVSGVLDCIDQYDDFEPTRDYTLSISETELSESERAARNPLSPDDVELSL